MPPPVKGWRYRATAMVAVPVFSSMATGGGGGGDDHHQQH
jgi:hypothetical protein